MTRPVDRPPVAAPVVNPDNGTMTTAWRVWSDQVFQRLQDLEARLKVEENDTSG